jgi:hypothetical protein
VRRAKRKRNKNDGLVRWVPRFYAVVFWLAFVRLLAAIPLLCHFCSGSFTLLPQALPLTDRKGDGTKKIRALHTALEKRLLYFATAATQKVYALAFRALAIFFVVPAVLAI